MVVSQTGACAWHPLHSFAIGRDWRCHTATATDDGIASACARVPKEGAHAPTPPEAGVRHRVVPAPPVWPMHGTVGAPTGERAASLTPKRLNRTTLEGMSLGVRLPRSPPRPHARSIYLASLILHTHTLLV